MTRVARARAALLGAALVVSAAVCATTARGQTFAGESGELRLPVPDFTLVERSGRRVSRQDLVGRPWIAEFAFTKCSGPCPKLTGVVARLQRDLAGTPVRLVTFTVDPENDTPQVLQDYAKSFGADPERWLFLTGPRDDVKRVVLDGFKLPIGRDEGQITHSTRLVLVDATATIVGYFDGADDVAVGTLLARARSFGGPWWVPRLPAVNASLNATAGVLLLMGFVAVKTRRIKAHKACMFAATTVSATFLASYVAYHVHHGSTPFPGHGAARTAYLALLATHVVLAIVALPLVLATLWFALRGDDARHRRVAKVTFPVWLYVSVTGVVVYFVLYHVYGCVP